ncbi:MAG: flagellar basal body P-ring formation protein FlgA [Phycisphaerales bacterium]|nr:flagellar basal body P-ring formation protein FlgA [Phycisphaerales bacterium]
MNRAVAAFIAVIAAAGAVLAQGTIELRPVARLAGAGPVTLGDVAELRGPEAEALAGVVLDEEPLSAGPGGWRSVDIARVREVLGKRKEVNWSRLTLVGRVCAIRREEPRPATPPELPESADPAEGRPMSEADMARCVRGMVWARIAEITGAGPERLRVSFDEQDRALLDQPVIGRRIELQPAGTSDRLPMQVTIFEGERIVASGTVRVDVKVKRPVLVVRRGLTRGQAITADDFTADEQWLAPRVRPATAARAVGAIARSALRAGEVLDESDFEAPLVVKKGELVTVHCLSGMVKVEMVARAMQAGRDGEVVAFQAADSKRTFQARMSGRGRAVVVTDGEATEERS